MEINTLKIANTFANSLEERDFESLAKILAPECAYFSGLGLIDGSEKILSSFVRNVAIGRFHLPHQVWTESQVEIGNEFSAAIFFTDFLKSQKELHVFRAKMELTLRTPGVIERMEFQVTPGEQKALDDFYQRISERSNPNCDPDSNRETKPFVQHVNQRA